MLVGVQTDMTGICNLHTGHLPNMFIALYYSFFLLIALYSSDDGYYCRNM